MSENNPRCTPEQWSDVERCLQRIADGESTTLEENDFLTLCERDPDQYRQLALELLERRRLRRALAYHSSPQPQPSNNRSRKTPALFWAGIAAALLIGLFSGIRFEKSGKSWFAPMESTAVNKIVPEQVLEFEPKVTNAGYDPEPLETLVSYAEKVQPQPIFDENAVREIQANGIQVDRYNRMFLIELSDGRKLAIPAEITFLSSE